MLKAIFFDMDETLCGTSIADKEAGQIFIRWIKQNHPQLQDEQQFLNLYMAGVYKKLTESYPELQPFLVDENNYRCKLIQTAFAEQNVTITLEQAQVAQTKFDTLRMQSFRFFPGTEQLLTELRKTYPLVVITNGPIFSQHPKLAAVNMQQWVDHIIVGGEEPEEKPEVSIFQKALYLVGATADEVIHIGDSLPADIAGANRSGITSVWINPDQQEAPENITPTYTIANIIELPQVIAHFNQ